MSAAPGQAGSSPEGPSAAERRAGETARRAGGSPPRAASLPGVDAARRGLRLRNALTGLSIGAIVAGIYAYTFYSVSQEHFLDELEVEAKVLQARAAKTPSD